jgi:bacterioferritin
MKGSKKVIDVLSEALAEELTAVNQYFLHAEMCANWGYGKLAGFIKKNAIGEMKHAEELIERILFLDGIPNMSKYMPIKIGRKVPEMLKNDMNLELGAIKMYNKGIAIARNEGDDGSADLLRKLLLDEEEHADWLETQLDQIKEIGLENYLTLWVSPEE